MLNDKLKERTNSTRIPFGYQFFQPCDALPAKAPPKTVTADHRRDEACNNTGAAAVPARPITPPQPVQHTPCDSRYTFPPYQHFAGPPPSSPYGNPWVAVHGMQPMPMYYPPAQPLMYPIHYPPNPLPPMQSFQSPGSGYCPGHHGHSANNGFPTIDYYQPHYPPGPTGSGAYADDPSQYLQH